MTDFMKQLDDAMKSVDLKDSEKTKVSKADLVSDLSSSDDNKNNPNDDDASSNWSAKDSIDLEVKQVMRNKGN